MVRRRSSGYNKQWKRGDRVLVYIRVSKVGNRQESLISDDVQEDVCRKWAEREGLTIVGEPVTDLDKSGREITKRQIQHSIERVRRGEAEGIVVWKVSRWGRNVIDSMLNVAALQDAGGFIASATENLDDIETPMGRFSLTQMLAIAQLQSDQIGETWRNIQDYRVGRGLPRSGKVRWGYIKNEIGRDDDPSLAFSEHPVQGPWLRSAYEQFVAGRSLMSIVGDMRDNGIMGNNGKPMTFGTLRKIMDSGFAAGLLVDRTDVPRVSGGSPKTTNPNACKFTRGAQPAIIDEQLWERYVLRRAEVRAPRETAAVHRLSGIAHCGSCGRKLITLWEKHSSPEPYRQFRCSYTRHNKNVASYCPAPVVMRQSYVEDAVFSWLERLARGEGEYDSAIERERQAERAQADVKTISSRIESLKDLRRKYLDMKAHAVDQDERDEIDQRRLELKGQINELVARREEIDTRLGAVEIPNVAAFGAALAAWEYGEVTMLNGVLRRLIQKVYVHRSPNGRGNRYSAGEDRVQVVGVWDEDPQPMNRLRLVADNGQGRPEQSDQDSSNGRRTMGTGGDDQKPERVSAWQSDHT